MSSTNKTAHYELPQFVENDIFNPLVDDNDAYAKIDTALYNIADAEADDAAEIVTAKGRLDTVEGKVDALETQNGTDVLTTVAQTLSGAVNELKSGEDSLDGRLDVVEDDINNVTTGIKARLTADEAAITAIEEKNGNTELNTTANTFSAAINEVNDKTKIGVLNEQFNAQRVGDLVGDHGGQCCVRWGTKYITAGEDGSTAFALYVYTSELALESKHSFEYDVHPNAIAIVDDYIYVLDSDHGNLYKIALSDFTVTATYTEASDGSNFGWGMSYYEDKFYFLRGTTIVVTDASFTIEKTITIDLSTFLGGSVVKQGIFVYGDYIYYVVNRPNNILIYDMDGNLLGVKDVGEGDGFYPYGELESLFEDGGKIYLFSGCFNIYKGTVYSFSEIFLTNLIGELPTNEKYGQDFFGYKEIYVDNRNAKVKNPDGTSTKPFTSAYEAACVYKYLKDRYSYLSGFAFFGTFSDDAFIISNCFFTIKYNNQPHFKYMYIDNCVANIYHTDVDDIAIYHSIVNYCGGNLGSITAWNSWLDMINTEITTSISATRSKFSGMYTLDSDVTVSLSACYTHEYRWRPNVSLGDITDGLQRDFDQMIYKMFGTGQVNMMFEFKITGAITGSTRASFPCNFYLSSNDLTTIVTNSGSVSADFVFPYWNGTNGVEHLKFRATLSRNGITFSNIVTIDGSGTASAYTGGLYLADMRMLKFDKE